MRFALLVVAAAGAGACAMLVVPPSLIENVGGDLGRARQSLAALNPLTAYDKMMRQALTGYTPEQLGFPRTPAMQPVSFPSRSFNFDAGSGFPSSNGGAFPQDQAMRLHSQNSAVWQDAPSR